jgi:hypothetical protein
VSVGGWKALGIEDKSLKLQLTPIYGDVDCAGSDDCAEVVGFAG